MDRGRRKLLTGTVVSDKMDKTVVVELQKFVKHPLYSKRVKRTVRYKAHDENNTCGIGDKVKIMETRKLSASKHFRLVEIIAKAK